ncbi:hypothetical protein V1J52_17770 [Streptomyces sp. TRM 70351]|uniref:hypothetical protein n=1 Tax=Streptomyces sp. TRM 70351 TaxID=3116552 RepID=UPI002E7B36EF|nr:hypothetical protein [Streptomyces sp. TRM 70351]MEE1930011.1 hypothetical protein [Streptomyces sp. TRM 70351]
MTASSATSGAESHPEVTEISALTEGLLPPARSTQVRTHLDGCPLCADVRTSLMEIRSVLGTLPGASRMPDDVAERIDAALSAEVLLHATTPGRNTSGGGEAEPDVTPHRAVAAGAAPAGKPGSAAPSAPRAARPVSRETRRPPGAPLGGGPGRDGRDGSGSRPGGRRRRRVLLGGVGALAALALAVLVLPDVLSTDAGDVPSTVQAGPSQEGEEEAAGSGPLADRVHALLAAAPASPPKDAQGQQPEQLGPDAQGRPNVPFSGEGDPAVPGCVRQAVGRAEAPLASGAYEHQGTAAYLVVLPHPGDSSRVDAYVVDAACVTSPSGAPGERLAVRTLDRR